MYMFDAKKTVVDAGIRLVGEGLVSRTWGNISARVDDRYFVITPSGRTYETLTPDDIVPLKMEDLTHEGHIKPSSEKGLHAEIYRARPDVAAIIHTHQLHASTVAAARRGFEPSGELMRRVIGDSVRVSAYALPGTGKLARSAARELGTSNAVLLANHGAVCVGIDMDAAFAVATALEKACMEFIEASFREYASIQSSSPGVIQEYYLKKFGRRT